MSRAQDIINRASVRGWLKSRWKSTGATVEGRVPLKGYDRLIIPERPRWRGAVLKRRAFLKAAIAAGVAPQCLLRSRRTWAIPAKFGFQGILNSGFLPSGHWVAAALSYAAIYPQPSGTGAYARHLKAYYDGTNPTPMILPMVMQGLALPIVWSLDEAPAGTAIGMIYSASGYQYEGYGDLVWYPQEAFSSGSPADFVVNGTGQDHTTEQLSWSTSTSSATSDFIFANATASSGGAGTISSPIGTTAALSTIYGATQIGSTSYAGARLYLRGNSSSVNYEAFDQTSVAGFTVSGSKNPICIMGYPGDPTPNIDTSALANTESSRSVVIQNWDDASDLFLQGFSFSGTSGSAAANFSYLWENYENNRLTYHNISAPNCYAGTGPTGNASLIEASDGGSGSYRQYMVIKGLYESNRPSSTQSNGIHDLYVCSYGVSEFCSCVASNGGSGFNRKSSISNWTCRFNFSTAALFPFLQFGQVNRSIANGPIEDCYNVAVPTGAGAGPPMCYNDSSTAVSGNAAVYRNTVAGGAIGVGNNAGSGTYTLQANAIQFSPQGFATTYYDTTTSTWTTASGISNITDSQTECEASTGVVNGSYNLTGSYATYFGTRGAQVG